MSKVTIIPSDNYVTVDNETQIFDYSDLISSDVWAINWDGGIETGNNNGIGRVETTTNHIDYDFEDITNFSTYQPIIDRFQSNKTTVDTATQIEFDEVTVIFKSGDSSQMTVAEAISAGIDFVELPLEDAQNKKNQEIKSNAQDVTNEYYQVQDVTGQTNARTMVNQDWNSLTSISPTSDRTTEQNDKISAYEEIKVWLNLVNDEYDSFTTHTMTLATTQEVMDYNPIFTSPPTAIMDVSRPGIKFAKANRF